MFYSVVREASSCIRQEEMQRPTADIAQRKSLRHIALSGMSSSNPSSQKSRNPSEDEAKNSLRARGDGGHRENKALRSK